jgi:predicted DNA-binding protein with PD1-like motif
MQRVDERGQRVYMGVLRTGGDLLSGLASEARAQKVSTATVELLGGLTQLELRSYNFDTQSRGDPVVLSGQIEVVAGHGTISQLDDELHVHLHLVVSAAASQSEASQLYGGHVIRAEVFAIEFTMTAYDGEPVVRAPDPATGLNLWDIP